MKVWYQYAKPYRYLTEIEWGKGYDARTPFYHWKKTVWYATQDYHDQLEWRCHWNSYRSNVNTKVTFNESWKVCVVLVYLQPPIWGCSYDDEGNEVEECFFTHCHSHKRPMILGSNNIEVMDKRQKVQVQDGAKILAQQDLSLIHI